MFVFYVQCTILKNSRFKQSKLIMSSTLQGYLLKGLFSKLPSCLSVKLFPNHLCGLSVPLKCCHVSPAVPF